MTLLFKRQTVPIMSSTTNTSNVIAGGSLLERSRSARNTNKQSHEASRAAKAARMEVHMARFTAELLNITRTSVISTTIGPLAEAVDNGRDSAMIDIFYFPAILKGEDGAPNQMYVPEAATYYCTPTEDCCTESTPVATMLLGVHDYKIKKNLPEKLPGGKTVISHVNEILEQEPIGSNLYNCTLAIEIGGDPNYKVPIKDSRGRTKPARCMKVMLVWDNDSYSQRRAMIDTRRDMERASRSEQKKTTTLEEHFAQKKSMEK